MRTDEEWIESFLEQKLNTSELQLFNARRSADVQFRQNLFTQGKVHLAALLFGRDIRRMQILSASEQAFSDHEFTSKINTIFR
jgi:hypothetical protein